MKYDTLHKDANEDEWDSIRKWMKTYKDERGNGISDDEITGFGNNYLFKDPEYVRGWAKKRGWNPHSPNKLDHWTWNQQ